MTWADYTSFSNKAKVHLGLDLNTGIPRKLYLTEGKAAERPFVSYILEVGQTGVVDRGYQDHNRFDKWIDEEKHFVARLFLLILTEKRFILFREFRQELTFVPDLTKI